MRIVKASALALLLSASMSVGVAMAADIAVPAPAKHGWVHANKHPICAFLLHVLTLGHHKSY